MKINAKSVIFTENPEIAPESPEGTRDVMCITQNVNTQCVAWVVNMASRFDESFDDSSDDSSLQISNEN